MQSESKSMLGIHLVALAIYLALCSIARGNEQVFKGAISSTIFITCTNDDQKTELGTGALINVENREAITAWHVVGNQKNATAFFAARDSTGNLITDPTYYIGHADERGIPCKVIAADPKRDVVVLQLDTVPVSATSMPLADRSVTTGENVHAIGNSGYADGTLWRYSSGTVRSVYNTKFNYEKGDGPKQLVDARVVETQCPTNPGDSGGPIMNDNGQLIAITHGSKLSETDVEYGIDVSEIKVALANAGVIAISQPLLSFHDSLLDLLNPSLNPGLNPSVSLRPPVLSQPPVWDQPPLVLNPPSTIDPPTPDFKPSVQQPPLFPLPPAGTVPLSADPSAKIIAVKKVPGVYRNGQKGLELHVELNVNNALGIPCEVEAIFVDGNGNDLPAGDVGYSTPDGQYLAVGSQIEAKFANSHFRDVVLFMPYAEVMGGLHTSGSYDFQVKVDVFNTRDQTWITSKPGEVSFTLNVQD